MNRSHISITMITYNRETFIEQAIHSVLAQSFDNWELIIIDDGSTDNTKDIIEKYTQDLRIKYIKNKKNQGIVFSRNKALKLSQGKYITVLDSDDVWHDTEKLKKQVSFLEEHKDYVLVGCKHIGLIDIEGKKIKNILNPEEDADIRNNFLYRNPFTHSSVLFRKDIVDELGGYHDYQVGEDYDLFLRMGLKGKMKNLSDVSISYRKHDANISVQKRKQALKLNIDIIKKYKKDYPYFWKGIIRRYIRFVLSILLFR